jgi:hypothetical protein
MTDANAAPDLSRSDMLQRPPHGRIVGTTTKPLIVTPTFVSRTDNTPEARRPHDAGFGVNRSGEEVADPDRHPAALALEADPNRAFEHYDEYWRKVHGPKFAYEEPGTSNDRVLRYDQVHRIASGPSSASRPPYRAMVDAAGRLVGDPAAQVPAYRRPSWDGFAYIAYGAEADIEAVLGQEQYAERIIADERTVFRMVTREVAREYIIIPSARHRDPVSLVKIHRRRPDLTRAAFQERWLRDHADVVAAKAATGRLRPTLRPASPLRIDAGGSGRREDRRHHGPILRVPERCRGLSDHRRSQGHRGGGGRDHGPEHLGVLDRGELQRDQPPGARMRDGAMTSSRSAGGTMLNGPRSGRAEAAKASA